MTSEIMKPFLQALDIIFLKKGEIIMEQIWKDVQDYEGLYQVSNDGDVISLRFEPPKHFPKP